MPNASLQMRHIKDREGLPQSKELPNINKQTSINRLNMTFPHPSVIFHSVSSR
jgi:hypothetical protein